MAVFFILVVICTSILGIEGRTLSYADQKRIALVRKITLPSLKENPEFLGILSNLDLQKILTMQSSHQEPFRQTNISSDCKRHMEYTVQEFQRKETWAIDMMDAQGKVPSGVFQGATKWLGAFDECKKITANIPETISFHLRGRYCSALIQDDFIRWGMCVPQSCQAEDIQSAIQIYLQAYSTHVTVNCQPLSQPGLCASAIIVICLCGILVAMMAVSTLYDLHFHRPVRPTSPAPSPEEESTPESAAAHIRSTLDVSHYTPLLRRRRKTPDPIPPRLSVRCLLAFSARNSYSRLFRSSAEEGMGCLDGIRVLSIGWIIFNNSFFLPIDMYDNILAVWDLSKTFSFQIVTNGSENVDSFFFLGGCLVCHNVLNSMDENNGFNRKAWLKTLLHRFLRFTPAYMLILGIYAAIMPFTGDGPLWEPGQFKDACSVNWWSNLLYINNLYIKGGQCMFWTWYLANEMQFFVLSPLFIYILRKRVALGIVITSIAIIGSCLASGLITYLNHYPASDAVALVNVSMYETNYYNDVYITPWCRIGPYLVGILCGFCLYKTSPPFEPALPAIFFWMLICAATFYLYTFLPGSRSDSISLELNGVFAGFHRVAWGGILFAVVFFCCRGQGGPINAVLSWPGFRPFCNTTFLAYLTHPVLIQWMILTARDPMHLSLGSLTWFYLGNLTLSFLAAFILQITIEAPLTSLGEIFLE